MPAYLVRIIDTRDLVGIFIVDDEDDPEFVMDECTDAPGCEYVETPAGGIVWASPGQAGAAHRRRPRRRVPP